MMCLCDIAVNDSVMFLLEQCWFQASYSPFGHTKFHPVHQHPCVRRIKHHRAVEEDTSKVGLAMFDTTLAHDEEQLLPLIWAAQYMVRSGLPGYRLPE